MSKILHCFLAFALVVVGCTDGKKSASSDLPPSYWTVEEQAKGLGVDLKKELPEKYTTVVYFHRMPSCDPCKKMARIIYSEMKNTFAEEVKARTINLTFIDFESKEYIPIAEMLGIKKPTLMLFESSPDGLRFHNASLIWSMVSEGDEAFSEYVHKEVQEFTHAVIR
jgi:thiol-disulfide isomerase/thioredoxin